MTTLITFNKDRKIGVVYIPEKKIIRKFSLEEKRYKLIKNENNGFNWYQLRRKNIFKSFNKIVQKEKNYLDLPIIKGKKKKFWDYLEKNYEDTFAVISHYQKIWPNKKLVPCHGDLTFSNIIFGKKDSIQIIDWENFSNNKMYWGFDLSYFLISTVSLPSIFNKDKKIKETELLLLEKLWKKTFANVNYKYLIKPVSFLKSNFGKTFVLRNYSNYYPNLLSQHKIKQINESLKL